MTCAYCGEEFFPTDNYHRRFCCEECRIKFHRLRSAARKIKHSRMLAEFDAWKRDFALGKTASNLST